jgi:hypothetical protein
MNIYSLVTDFCLILLKSDFSGRLDATAIGSGKKFDRKIEKILNLDDFVGKLFTIVD